jgi:hypothetical protein
LDEPSMRARAESLARLGRHAEAASAFLQVGDDRAALDNLVRVSSADGRYRGVARAAVQLAARMNVVELRFEHFLSTFIGTGPRDDVEAESFCDLARLYLAQGFRENAEEALRKVLARTPDHPDALAQMQTIRGDARTREKPPEELLRSDLDFRQGKPTPRPQPVAELAAPPPPADPSPTPVTMHSRGTTRVLAAPIPPSPFHAGAVVAGRYRIESEIGRGGMATVYRALDMELGEEIALKVFAEGDRDPTSLERFRQELRVSRRLNHPNLVRVYDLGLHAGRRYISMELLAGDTLAVQMGRPLSFSKGIGYLLDACAGLQAAHQEGIVHRDIKPGNLFITTEDRVKIMDFGIARQLTAPGLTVEGVIVGTPAYMSPEQIRGFSTVGPTADLYALGIVAYEMFTGQPPFHHENVVPVLMMHLEDKPPPPRSRNAEMPERLEAILLKLLEKQPERRYRDCRALTDALEGLLN